MSTKINDRVLKEIPPVLIQKKFESYSEEVFSWGAKQTLPVRVALIGATAISLLVPIIAITFVDAVRGIGYLIHIFDGRTFWHITDKKVWECCERALRCVADNPAIGFDIEKTAYYQSHEYDDAITTLLKYRIQEGDDRYSAFVRTISDNFQKTITKDGVNLCRIYEKHIMYDADCAYQPRQLRLIVNEDPPNVDADPPIVNSSESDWNLDEWPVITACENAMHRFFSTNVGLNGCGDKETVSFVYNEQKKAVVEITQYFRTHTQEESDALIEHIMEKLHSLQLKHTPQVRLKINYMPEVGPDQVFKEGWGTIKGRGILQEAYVAISIEKLRDNGIDLVKKLETFSQVNKGKIPYPDYKNKVYCYIQEALPKYLSQIMGSKPADSADKIQTDVIQSRAALEKILNNSLLSQESRNALREMALKVIDNAAIERLSRVTRQLEIHVINLDNVMNFTSQIKEYEKTLSQIQTNILELQKIQKPAGTENGQWIKIHDLDITSQNQVTIIKDTITWFYQNRTYELAQKELRRLFSLKKQINAKNNGLLKKRFQSALKPLMFYIPEIPVVSNWTRDDYYNRFGGVLAFRKLQCQKLLKLISNSFPETLATRIGALPAYDINLQQIVIN